MTKLVAHLLKAEPQQEVYSSSHYDGGSIPRQLGQAQDRATADTTVVSADLVPDNAKEGTILAKGIGSEYTPCPLVSIPVYVKGEHVEFKAIRQVVGRDVLLGRGCLGLEVVEYQGTSTPTCPTNK